MREFTEAFGCHWIGVKFFPAPCKESCLTGEKDLFFCQAINDGLLSPVVINGHNLKCAGARYVFGWDKSPAGVMREDCISGKRKKPGLIRSFPRLKNKCGSIGIETAGKPDVAISCMTPDNVMRLIEKYVDRTGKTIKTELSCYMSVCGAVAVKAFLTKEICISFGCRNSRKYAQIGGQNLVVGVPKNLFGIIGG